MMIIQLVNLHLTAQDPSLDVLNNITMNAHEQQATDKTVATTCSGAELTCQKAWLHYSGNVCKCLPQVSTENFTLSKLCFLLLLKIILGWFDTMPELNTKLEFFVQPCLLTLECMQNRLGFHSSHPTLANATLTPGRKSWQTKCWLLEKKDQKFRDIYTFKALKCATFITVISVSCLYDHLNVTHEIPSKQSCCLLCRVPVRQESLLSHKTCGNLLEQNICF